jgi:zinc transport system substrate-binding protein
MNYRYQVTLPAPVFFGALLALAAADAAPPLKVVVSLPPQVWLVESIGGPLVSTVALVGPGDSEETYSPTDAQVSAALRAKVFFRIGASFEQAPWFRALSSSRALEIVDLRHGVDFLRLRDDVDAEPPALDPHIWLSPRRLGVQARTVAAELIRLDPEHRERYEQGLVDVTRELELLDRELGVSLLPYRGRSFFVFHPTWGYFAHDYGLRQVAIEQEGNPPTDRELTRLQELARAAGIRTLFVQPQIAGRSAEAVAAAVGATVVRLDPLAADVPGNLRLVARRLAESFAP